MMVEHKKHWALMKRAFTIYNVILAVHNLLCMIIQYTIVLIFTFWWSKRAIINRVNTFVYI